MPTERFLEFFAKNLNKRLNLGREAHVVYRREDDYLGAHIQLVENTLPHLGRPKVVSRIFPDPKTRSVLVKPVLPK